MENGRLLAYLAAHGEVLSKQYRDSRVVVHCRIPSQHLGRIQEDSICIRPHQNGATRQWAADPGGGQSAASRRYQRLTGACTRSEVTMKRELKNRRAIVTGASSGIGRETALALAAAGVSWS